jgi:hypothetical protein
VSQADPLAVMAKLVGACQLRAASIAGSGSFAGRMPASPSRASRNVYLANVDLIRKYAPVVWRQVTVRQMGKVRKSWLQRRNTSGSC